jgi:hypothetical protein
MLTLHPLKKSRAKYIFAAMACFWSIGLAPVRGSAVDFDTQAKSIIRNIVDKLNNLPVFAPYLKGIDLPNLAVTATPGIVRGQVIRCEMAHDIKLIPNPNIETPAAFILAATSDKGIYLKIYIALHGGYLREEGTKDFWLEENGDVVVGYKLITKMDDPALKATLDETIKATLPLPAIKNAYLMDKSVSSVKNSTPPS